MVWFKRDLRLEDHQPLRLASLAGPVIPLYIFEPSLWTAPDFDRLHGQFIVESLAELREELAHLGQPLVIRIGEVPEVLHELHAAHTILHLWSHEETGTSLTFARDRAVSAWCRSQHVSWTETRQFGVVRGPLDRDGWQRQWHTFMHTPVENTPTALQPVLGINPGDLPTVEQLKCTSYHPATPQRCDVQRGGIREARHTLDSFLETRGTHYHSAMSSPITAYKGCSRLSPYLAWGCLSMRTLAQRVHQRQEEMRALPPANRPSSLKALRAFNARLHWHCHFIQKLESEPAIEFHCFNRLCDSLRDSGTSDEHLEAWISGRTGYPFVDACMRSLQTRGWINFRMRAMLTSFAAYDLWIDWRMLNHPLARQFTDYEPGIHLSQLQMQSGVTGINTLRMYNPVKQGYDHDPNGDFIRFWVPELGGSTGAALHEPWTLDHPPSDYPAPVVNHADAIRDARAKFAALRRSEGFSEESKKVYAKHGSRKRPGKRRPKAVPKPPDPQTELNL